jgi:hypothetical protein
VRNMKVVHSCLVIFAVALGATALCWSRPLVDSEHAYVNAEKPGNALMFTSRRTLLYDGHGLSIDLRPCSAGIASVCVESALFAIAVPKVSVGERQTVLGSFTCRAIGDYTPSERMKELPPVIFAECQSAKTRLTLWFSPARGLLGFIYEQGESKGVWVLGGECGLGASQACSEH